MRYANAEYARRGGYRVAVTRPDALTGIRTSLQPTERGVALMWRMAARGALSGEVEHISVW